MVKQLLRFFRDHPDFEIDLSPYPGEEGAKKAA